MPIQTELLRGLRKSSGGTGIVIPVKKVPQGGKYRNPEDSSRNYQPSDQESHGIKKLGMNGMDYVVSLVDRIKSKTIHE